jgi:hypothetical protein
MSKISTFITRLLDPETALITKYFVDDCGKLKMGNPTVQGAILKLIKADLVDRANEIEKEAKAKK